MNINTNPQHDKLVTPTIQALIAAIGYDHLRHRVQAIEWFESDRITPLEFSRTPTRDIELGQNYLVEHAETFGADDPANGVYPLSLGVNSLVILRRMDWIKRTGKLEETLGFLNTFYTQGLSKHEIDKISLGAMRDGQEEAKTMVLTAELLTASCIFLKHEMPEKFLNYTRVTLDFLVQMTITQRNKKVYQPRTQPEEDQFAYDPAMVAATASHYVAMVTQHSVAEYYPGIDEMTKNDDVYISHFERLSRNVYKLSGIDGNIAVRSFLSAASTFCDLPIPVALQLRNEDTESLYHQAMAFLTNTSIACEVKDIIPARPSLHVVK